MGAVSRLNITWALLALATLVSWGLSDPEIIAVFGVTFETVIVLVLAAIKVDLVISQFMEVKRHHRPLRLILLLWSLVIVVIILGGYLAIEFTLWGDE